MPNIAAQTAKFSTTHSFKNGCNFLCKRFYAVPGTLLSRNSKMIERLLGRKEIQNIAYGATLLGSGGGGSPKSGLVLAESALKASPKGIRLISPEDVPDVESAAMIAGIGSPVALLQKGFDVEAIYAYDVLERAYAMAGQKVSYIIPGELGGFNTITPMFVAARKGLPIVDADGCGRAVPELETSLFYLYGVPNSPCVLANKKGDVVVLYTRDPMDAFTCEIVARNVCAAFDNAAAFATWVVNGKLLREALALNTVSKCEKIGKAIEEARQAGKDPVSVATEVAGGYELIRGVIADITTRTVAGFDFGTTTIEGRGAYQGKTLKVDFKNENMIAWRTAEEPVAMVPDLICFMTIQGEPLTNADTKKGMEIAVIGAPAPDKWRKHPKGFEVWRHILQKIGYSESYTPIEKLI